MEDLEKAVASAKNAHLAIMRQIKLEKDNASAAIDATYYDEKSIAHKAVCDAEIALRNHINATASHEWEGKKVVRTVRRGDTWSRITATEYGVVEVRRIGSEMPLNQSWGLPDLGKPYVRILKKDGTLGKKIDAGYNGGIPHAWSLCDEEQTKAA